MPVELKKFPVPWFRQQLSYYCGPATAQMVLSHLGFARTQDHLWGLITSKTVGTRPPNAPPTPGQYPSQHCYDCGNWHCWDTLPQSLALAMNAELPYVRYTALHAPTIDAGITALVDSIRKPPQVPPFATLWAVNHWIVVTGYHAGDDLLPGMPPVDVAGLPLNGVYINDPQWADDSGTLRLVSTGQFRRAFGLINCGPNTDRHPIVVGTDLFWLIRILILIWIKLKWFTMKKDA